MTSSVGFKVGERHNILTYLRKLSSLINVVICNVLSLKYNWRSMYTSHINYSMGNIFSQSSQLWLIGQSYHTCRLLSRINFSHACVDCKRHIDLCIFVILLKYYWQKNCSEKEIRRTKKVPSWHGRLVVKEMRDNLVDLLLTHVRIVSRVRWYRGTSLWLTLIAQIQSSDRKGSLPYFIVATTLMHFTTRNKIRKREIFKSVDLHQILIFIPL